MWSSNAVCTIYQSNNILSDQKQKRKKSREIQHLNLISLLLVNMCTQTKCSHFIVSSATRPINIGGNWQLSYRYTLLFSRMAITNTKLSNEMLYYCLFCSISNIVEKWERSRNEWKVMQMLLMRSKKIYKRQKAKEFTRSLSVPCFSVSRHKLFIIFWFKQHKTE